MSQFDMPGLVVLDDFFPEFDRVREHAKLSQFYDWKGPDGQVYKRITILHVPGMAEKLHKELGNIQIVAMGYRLNYAGEAPNQSIHSDLGYATHACVVYLNPGESGTAFWKHKATGATEICFGQQDLLEKIKEDFEQPDAWEQQLVVPVKPNRAVIYRGNIFHSRFPFEAFGDNPDNGRMIALAFFRFVEDDE